MEGKGREGNTNLFLILISFYKSLHTFVWLDKSKLSKETYMRDKGLTFYIIMLQIRGEWIAKWGAVKHIGEFLN